MSTFPSPLITASDLNELQDNPNLVILDATMGHEPSTRIPRARRFDIDNKFSDPANPFPHGLPSPQQFENAARSIGINNSSIVVVYERKATFAAPRAWWLLRAMGHSETYILDGGRVAWETAGFDVTEPTNEPIEPGDFTANFDPNWFVVPLDDVRQALTSPEAVVLDARAKGRFDGTSPEPRDGIRSGHMPGALNLPFQDVTNDDGTFKQPDELRELLTPLIGAPDEQPQQIITSCGSGVTAAVIGLAAQLAGYSNIAIFDGSWTQWASTPGAEIETA